LNLQASKSGYQESFKNIQGSDERNKVHDGTLELLSQQEIEKQEQLVEQRKKEQERIQAEREKERALVQAEKVKEKLQKEKKNDIAANRILAKGYGESQPLVKCETEESCSEEDHEWNRRCEFTIVNWE